MPVTPDRSPGPLVEEEVQLEDNGADPSVVGGITNNAGTLKAQDSLGIFNLRTGSSGISEGEHEVLDTLVHELAEDYYLEVTRSSGRVTDIVYWTDSGKSTKIREVNITRSAGKVSQVVLKQYDGTGTLITGQTLTLTINRTAGRVSSIDAVET